MIGYIKNGREIPVRSPVMSLMLFVVILIPRYEVNASIPMRIKKNTNVKEIYRTGIAFLLFLERRIKRKEIREPI